MNLVRSSRARLGTARRVSSLGATAVLGLGLLVGVAGCAPFTLSLTVPAGEQDSEPSQAAPRESRPAQVTEPAQPPKPGPSAAASCPDGSPARDFRFTDGTTNGAWNGTVREASGKTYRVDAVLRDEGCELSGTFTYVELGCSGTWTAATVEDVSEPAPGPRGIRARITEEVTHDPQQACASTARVQLVFGPAGMLYSSGWDMPDGSAAASTAQLEPVL